MGLQREGTGIADLAEGAHDLVPFDIAVIGRQMEVFPAEVIVNMSAADTLSHEADGICLIKMHHIGMAGIPANAHIVSMEAVMEYGKIFVIAGLKGHLGDDAGEGGEILQCDTGTAGGGQIQITGDHRQIVLQRL